MLDGMRKRGLVARFGVAAALFAGCALEAGAQQTGTQTLQVCVHDETGSAIANARIKATGAAEVLSDVNGCAKLTAAASGTVEITRDGLAPSRSRWVRGRSWWLR